MTAGNYRKLALVIGAGSSMCAASLGLWRVYQEAGVPISMTVGCSAGSMFAALIALGYNLEQAETKTKELWTSDLFEGYTTNLRAALTGETRFTERSGLVDDRTLTERLQRIFGGLTFADTQIPLFIVSTDLYSGESVVHSSGALQEAIRASLAIPMIFSPWQIGERLLVDVAVSDPLPIDVAIKEGGEVIVAMGFALPARTRMRTYSAVAAHFNNLYINNLLQSRYAFYNLAHHAEIIPVLPDFGKPVGAFDTTNISAIIEAGADAAQEQLPYVLRLLAVTP